MPSDDRRAARTTQTTAAAGATHVLPARGPATPADLSTIGELSTIGGRLTIGELPVVEPARDAGPDGDTDAGRPPALSLVITTVGRPERLARLLDSIDSSAVAGALEVVLVDQSADRASTDLFTHRPARYARQVATSARGAGAGRRVGLALATGELVAIPNDDCWYSPRVLAEVVDRFAADDGLAGVCGRQRTGDGRDSGLRWAAHAGPVTRTNFDRTGIASTMFLRRAAVDAAGSISDRIGTGSAGPFQAGEESDLILRMIARGDRVRYDPALVVFKEEQRDRPDPGWAAKMLAYGRGQGYLWRVHHLSRPQMAYRITRKLVAGGLHLIRGRPVVARGDLAFAAGWADGFRRARRLDSGQGPAR